MSGDSTCARWNENWGQALPYTLFDPFSPRKLENQRLGNAKNKGQVFLPKH